MMEKFTDYVNDYPNDYGLCPPPIEPQKALSFLHNYLLGEDYSLSSMPISVSQGNTELVHALLMKYSRKYRKEYRNRERERR